MRNNEIVFNVVYENQVRCLKYLFKRTQIHVALAIDEKLLASLYHHKVQPQIVLHTRPRIRSYNPQKMTYV